MVQISSTQPDLYFLKIMEFSHYNEYGVNCDTSYDTSIEEQDLKFIFCVFVVTLGSLKLIVKGHFQLRTFVF